MDPDFATEEYQEITSKHEKHKTDENAENEAELMKMRRQTRQRKMLWMKRLVSMKWIKKEVFNNRQKRWERGENDMKHRKASVSWQNDTVELSRKKQVVKSCTRTGYTRASHRQIIVKTDIYGTAQFYDVRLTTNHILCSMAMQWNT
jgi:hypothetical protein